MALDGMLLAGIASSLDQLEKAKIGKIQNLSDEEIMFSTHGPKGSHKLLVNVHSNTNRLYLSRRQPEFLPTPTNFVMVLRKHISQGIIESIEQAGFDRILKIRIAGHNELGDAVHYNLYAELMGKYANLILTRASDDVIIDCLKRIPVYENSKRLLHPGAVYALPPKEIKQNPLKEVTLDLETSLVRQVEGFSPQLSREYIYRMHEGQSFEDITRELLSSDRLYVYSKDFHILEMKHLQEQPRVFELMDGLDHLYAQNEQKIRIQQQAGDVFKAVDKELRRLDKKLPKLEASLQASLDYDKYRIYGDLIFAYMHQIGRQPDIVLQDFETGRDVKIPLDQRFDAKTNANLYYKKYRKAKRSLDILSEQIDQCRQDIEYYSQLQEQLKHCSAEDALEIREELVKNRILRQEKGSFRKKKNKNPHVLHLALEDAYIYVGKNNLQNQYITHKLSRKEDLWFHVKDYHGSHVLLKCSSPTEELIRLCAMLAAWFSKGRDSSSVPVDYTTVSNLKKVPGSKIGFVTMKSYKTIYIDPAAAFIEEAIRKYKKKESGPVPVQAFFF